MMESTTNVANGDEHGVVTYNNVVWEHLQRNPRMFHSVFMKHYRAKQQYYNRTNIFTRIYIFNNVDKPKTTTLVGLFWRFYVASTIFQSYRDLEAGDTQSLKSEWRDPDSNSGPLALQAKSLATPPTRSQHLLGIISTWPWSWSIAFTMRPKCDSDDGTAGGWYWLTNGLDSFVVDVPTISWSPQTLQQYHMLSCLLS